jgi:hypothetical protein
LQSLSLSSEFEKHGVSLGDGVAKLDMFATALELSSRERFAFFSPP